MSSVQLRPRRRAAFGICPRRRRGSSGLIPLLRIPLRGQDARRWAEGGARGCLLPHVRAPIPGGGWGLDPRPVSAGPPNVEYGVPESVPQPGAVRRSSSSSASSTSRASRPAIAAFVSGGSAFAASSRSESEVPESQLRRSLEAGARLGSAPAADSDRAACSCVRADRLCLTRFAWSAFASRFASARNPATSARSSSESTVSAAPRPKGRPRSRPSSSHTPPSGTHGRLRACARRRQTRRCG